MSQLLDQPAAAGARLDAASSVRASREEPGHLPALDGVRGLAILMVMLTHFILIEKGAL